MEFSEKIKNLRLSLGYEQHEFAQLMDVTVGTVSNWENGRRNPRLPKLRKMVEIAKKNKLKLEMKDFLT